MSETLTERALAARLLRVGEVLPEKYDSDPLFQVMKYDPNWVWVLEEEGQVAGYLITTPTYPMVTMLRVRIDDSTSASGLIVLLRQFFHDIRQRTFQTVSSHFDMTEETEKRLAYCMVKLLNGRMFVNVCAPLPKEE